MPKLATGTLLLGRRLVPALLVALVLLGVAVLRLRPAAANAAPAPGDLAGLGRYVAANFADMRIPGLAFGLVPTL